MADQSHTLATNTTDDREFKRALCELKMIRPSEMAREEDITHRDKLMMARQSPMSGSTWRHSLHNKQRSNGIGKCS